MPDKKQRNRSRNCIWVKKCKDSGEFIGLCSRYPSLSWIDNTYEGAYRGMSMLLQEIIIDLIVEEINSGR